jgi:hypothetical protein
MSDISILSSQYEKLVSTSDQVNNSVIILKKHNLLQNQDAKRYPRLQVGTSDVSTASELLIPFLQNIIKLLEDHSQESDFIPFLIVENYVRKLSSNQFMREDLEDLVNKLKSKLNLDEKNIAILDGILAVLDTERSELFRKLRTARG